MEVNRYARIGGGLYLVIIVAGIVGPLLAEKAKLLHAIYERIKVAGPEIVGVRLTAAADAHGLALALSEG